MKAHEGGDVVLWLEARLCEERLLLERRHESLCASLRDLQAAPPVVPQQCSTIDLQDQWPAAALEAARLLETEVTSSQGLLEKIGDATTYNVEVDAERPLVSEDQPASAPVIVEPRPSAASLNDSDLQRQNTTARTCGQPSFFRRRSQQQHQNILVRVVLNGQFDLFFGCLIVMNAVAMSVDVQRMGVIMDDRFGFSSRAPSPSELASWHQVHMVLQAFEVMFGLFFTLEVAIKLAVFRHRFFCQLWNLFDGTVMMFWAIEYFSEGLQLAINPTLLRVCRVVRLLRLLRLMKMTSMFDTLVLMLSSIQASVFVLFWGIVVLLIVMVTFAFFIRTYLVAFMENESFNFEDRRQVYLYFGTMSKSMTSMFEVTMGNWVPILRCLGERVSEWFALFFLIYRGLVGFAVFQVISGVFLHETFKCAALDDDLMIMHRRSMRLKFQKKMRQFFQEADMSAHGEVSVAEFEAMINDDEVNTWLEAMDLRIRDVGARRIFAFLAGPDMMLSQEELLQGMARLRGPSQGLDVLTLLELSAPDLRLPVNSDVQRLRDEYQIADSRAVGGDPPKKPLSESELAVQRLRQATLEVQKASLEIRSVAHAVRKVPDQDQGKLLCCYGTPSGASTESSTKLPDDILAEYSCKVSDDVVVRREPTIWPEPVPPLSARPAQMLATTGDRWICAM